MTLLLDKNIDKFTSFDAYINGKPLNLSKDCSSLGGSEVRVEPKVLFMLVLPSGETIEVRAETDQMISEVLRPIISQYGWNLDDVVVMLDRAGGVDLRANVSSINNTKLVVIRIEDGGCEKGSDFVIKDSANVEEKGKAVNVKTNLKPSAPHPPSRPPRTCANSVPLTLSSRKTIEVSNSSPIPHSPSSLATDNCKTSEKMDSETGTALRNTEISGQGLFVDMSFHAQQYLNVSSGLYNPNMSAGSNMSTSLAAFDNETSMSIVNRPGAPMDQSYMTQLHSNNNNYHVTHHHDAVVAEQSMSSIPEEIKMLETQPNLDTTVSAEDTLPIPPRTSTPIPGVNETVTTMLDFTSIIFKEKSHQPQSVTGSGCPDPDPLTPASSVTVSNKHCPPTDFMKDKWTLARTLKNTMKGICKKSKKIVKPKGKRPFFTKEQLSLATNILYSCRRVYKMLRNQKILDLPHIRTVYRHLERFKCWPGMNQEMFRLLTLFLSSLEPEDRVCGVLADEIKLAEGVSWSARLKTLFKAHKVGTIFSSARSPRREDFVCLSLYFIDLFSFCSMPKS